MSLQLHLGPLMVDVEGLELTEADRQRLLHPLVGGVIIFKRNFQDPMQLRALTDAIHALRSPALPIAIDHEGGRVQRCRKGFTQLPAMRQLGQWWDIDPDAAVAGARDIGYLLAAELRECGVDLSFTPVLDLEWGTSSVIGDRSFHSDPNAVVALAGALIDGLRLAGMGCVGKHFPGHGWVAADSHVAIPVDTRSFAEMENDMRPYRELRLTGVMPAHVIYPQVDARPAGFSPVWLRKLREEFGFEGAIFSDDLSMEGASTVGGPVQRVDAAWTAGCDMLLLCNAPDKVDEVLVQWSPVLDPVRCARIERLAPSLAAEPAGHWKKNPAWMAGWTAIGRLTQLMS
jgi:beta-N-acetylhexosaminidase